MNFALGSFLDNMDPAQEASQARWGTHTHARMLLAVYRHDDVL